MPRYIVKLINPVESNLNYSVVEFDGIAFSGGYMELLKYVKNENEEIIKTYTSFLCKTKDLFCINLVE